MSLKKLLLAILLTTVPAAAVTAQTNGEASKGANGEEARSAIRRGNEKYTQANYRAALEEYSRVPENSGEAYAQSLYNIGVCYYELYRTEDAIIFYQRAIAAREGRYPRAWYALGVALEDRGRLKQAKEAFKQSISSSRDGYALAQFKLGVLAAAEGDYSTAAVLFKKAGARSGEHVASSHNNLGVVLAHLGRLTEAEREFEVALKQANGTFDDAAHNLQLCRSMLSTTTKTLVASLKLVETTPVLLK